MKRCLRSLLPVFLILSLSTSCGQHKNTAPSSAEKQNPKNIILVIGDGMGLSQVSLTYYYQDSSAFSAFPVIGLISTSSSHQKITDSAASGTAFATGFKTRNGMLGMDPDSSTLENIVEILSGFGMKTAVVSTAPITHATPAAFYAHIDSRGKQEEIAEQLLTSDIDLFIGGGHRFFSERKDGRNLFAEDHGVQLYENTLDSIKHLDIQKRYGFVFDSEALPPAHKGRGPLLTEFTDLALQHLQACRNGFFLMLEAAQIDWAGHDMDVEGSIAEMKDMDDMLRSVLDFARKDGNTLVIVTGDHETGGLLLPPAKKEDGRSDYSDIAPLFATSSHTAVLLPLFACGPGAELFSGVYSNSDLFNKILSLKN